MSQVVDWLYIGDFRHAQDLTWLKKHKITHIVNMTIEHPNYHPNRFYYYKAHAYDTNYQLLEDILRRGYTFMKKAVDSGGIILVHCHAGISRSSSMVLYYLMRTFQVPLIQAFRHLKMIHPRANPNPSFWKQLSMLES